MSSHLELVKWAGVFCMLVDHVALYVTGSTEASEAWGSLALPLFAFALAEGTRAQDYGRRMATLERLLVWALVAQVALLTVRELQPLNVVFSLCVGLWIDTTFRYAAARSHRALAIAAGCGVGFGAEFGHFAMLLTLAMCHNSRERSVMSVAVVLAALLPLSLFNGSHWAFAALGVIALAAIVPRDLPRTRGAFYWIYAAQWPALAVVTSVFGRSGT